MDNFAELLSLESLEVMSSFFYLSPYSFHIKEISFVLPACQDLPCLHPSSSVHFLSKKYQQIHL